MAVTRKVVLGLVVVAALALGVAVSTVTGGPYGDKATTTSPPAGTSAGPSASGLDDLDNILNDIDDSLSGADESAEPE
jgi:hypothetical protein